MQAAKSTQFALWIRVSALPGVTLEGRLWFVALLLHGEEDPVGPTY
jgi:hypothetical protein